MPIRNELEKSKDLYVRKNLITIRPWMMFFNGDRLSAAIKLKKFIPPSIDCKDFLMNGTKEDVIKVFDLAILDCGNL